MRFKRCLWFTYQNADSETCCNGRHGASAHVACNATDGGKSGEDVRGVFGRLEKHGELVRGFMWAAGDSDHVELDNAIVLALFTNVLRRREGNVS